MIRLAQVEVVQYNTKCIFLFASNTTVNKITYLVTKYKIQYFIIHLHVHTSNLVFVHASIFQSFYYVCHYYLVFFTVIVEPLAFSDLVTV